MNIPRMGNKVPKLGMFSKVVPFVAILSTLVACATPPRVVNDPSIPDNGAVIIGIGNQQYPMNCMYPYQVGPYCDPYYMQGPGRYYMPQPPNYQIILNPRNNAKVVDEQN